MEPFEFNPIDVRMAQRSEIKLVQNFCQDLSKLLLQILSIQSDFHVCVQKDMKNKKQNKNDNIMHFSAIL